MTTKVLVPPHRIPRIAPKCVQCFSGNVRTVIAAPFADGYHRRHRCADCQRAFYTLAPYGGELKRGEDTEARVSDKPFKDREQSDYEQGVFYKWWSEKEQVAADVTMEVTLGTRLDNAMRKAPELRTRVEAYLTKVHDAVVAKVKEIEDAGRADV